MWIGSENRLSSYINDEFGELVGVAWSLARADGHGTTMPQPKAERHPVWISNCNSTGRQEFQVKVADACGQ
jgi:hypothetical protein